MMFPTFPLVLSIIALSTIIIPINALPTQNHISLINAPSTSLLSRRSVYSPHIISPAQGDNWKVGTWVEVTWFVSARFYSYAHPASTSVIYNLCMLRPILTLL